jgi:hypothetical protein
MGLNDINKYSMKRLEEILVDYEEEYSRDSLTKAKKEILNLFSVMLSETLEQAEKKDGKIYEIQDPSGMEAVGFSNGADWVVKKLKEKLHSA